MSQRETRPRDRLAARAALAVAAVTFAGCSSGASTSTPAATSSLTVSAAASLSVPFGRIGGDFERANPGTSVRFNFDASSSLVTQIEAGAPADVVATADEASMDRLVRTGRVEGEPRVFARNKMAIVVKHGNPEGIRNLGDLAGAGVVALCATGIPCGNYADEILRRAGVSIPEGHVTRGQNVKATLTSVSDGDAVAGIVYTTDAAGAPPDRIGVVAIPDDQNATATYPIAVVRGSANRSQAEAFVAQVTGPSGRSILRESGFEGP